MNNNPFLYGSPISNPSRFIGRENEVNQVLGRLCNEAVESSSIVGSRRIGKTSLLNILEQNLLNESGKYVSLHPLLLDFQMFSSQATPKHFWDRVLQQMSQISLPYQSLKSHTSALQKAESRDTFALNDLFHELDDAGISIILLLDEFEQVTSNTNFGPDFFYALRSLAIHHRFAIVTSSYAELIKLSHSEEVRASPFFNIFATIHLGAFEQEETENFFDCYLAGTGIRFSESEKRFLASIAGTHPYYLQIGGYFLFEAYQHGAPRDERMSYTLRRFSNETEDTLAHIWYHSTDEEKISLTVLAILESSRNDRALQKFSKNKLNEYYGYAESILTRLSRSGIVCEHIEGYTLFSTVFAKWIQNELRSTLTISQTYEEWLNDPANQRRLTQIKAGLENDIKEKVLPKLKENYWAMIVGWLTNPETVNAAFRLLRLWLG